MEESQSPLQPFQHLGDKKRADVIFKVYNGAIIMRVYNSY